MSTNGFLSSSSFLCLSFILLTVHLIPTKDFRHLSVIYWDLFIICTSLRYEFLATAVSPAEWAKLSNTVTGFFCLFVVVPLDHI